MHFTVNACWLAFKCILYYLCGTLFFGLHFTCQSDLSLNGFNDYGWTNIVDRKSTSDYAIFLGHNLMPQKYDKQHIVARTFIEVEYKTIDNAIVGLKLARSLIHELSIFEITSHFFVD